MRPIWTISSAAIKSDFEPREAAVAEAGQTGAPFNKERRLLPMTPRNVEEGRDAEEDD